MNKWLKRLGFTALFAFVVLNVICAFHAYKFTHFYNGTSAVTPPEQMGFAEKMNTLFFGVRYNRKLIKEVPAHPFTTIFLTTHDHLKLEAWYLQQPAAKGTIIMFHGHGGNRSGIVNEVNAFYKLGYNVLMPDFRAHGNSEGNVCTIGYTEKKDVKAAYDYVKNLGEKNIIAWGISLGAASILGAIDQFEDVRPAKVILEMPFGSLTEAVKGRLRIMNLPEQPFATLLTFWGGVQQGFWAFNLKPAAYATAVTMPVLLQWGKNDPRVSQQETDAIYKNLAAANKKLVVYGNAAHESLYKKQPAQWLANVGAFLQE